MNKKTFDSVILDIDGTIWNTTHIVADAWNDAVRPYDEKLAFITAERLQSEFGKTMDIIAKDLWSDVKEETRKILMEDCCRLEHIAVESNTKDISYPSVIDTVKELSHNIDFYVVSNCQNGYIELTLNKTGLTPYIKDFECYGHTGLGKAENISLIVKRNNLNYPVYIGDTQGDCNECKKARVPFIWASYGFGKADSCIAKLTGFDEIKKILF